MKEKKQSPLFFLWEVSSKSRFRLVMAAFLVLLSSLCYMGPFYIAYLVIDGIGGGGMAAQEIITLGAYAALFILAQMLFAGIAMTQSHVAAYDMLFDLRVRLAHKLTSLPLGYYSASSSGLIKKIMMEDIEAIEEFVAHNLVTLLSVVFTPILIFSWLVSINVLLAIVSMIPVILGVTLQRVRMRRDAQAVKAFFRLKGEMNSTIVDFIRGMPVIKMFNQSVFSFKRYVRDADRYSSHWIEMNRRAAGYMAVYVLLMECGVIFLLPLGAYMHISGEITVSTFMLFMFMGLGFARFMKQLTGFGSRITQIMKGVEQLMSVLGTPGIPEGKGDSMPDNFDLEFRDVSFSYGRQAVLRNIGFRVRRGQVLALVGPSGAGKTTIARLIARFYDADSGRITIGGTDIREFSSERLMRTVSFVFQDVFMFNDTVLENIRMGDSSVSREKVMELARKARAHEFIMKMDKGYDTRLGAGGVHLSGGEQQRISIARAMAKETPIVVLDEATSYSDTENEAEIQAALSSLLEGRTVIVIAHRLSSITESDGIIVIRDGSIVEQGKHHELLEKKGLYSRMWETHRDSSDWEIPVSGCVKTHEEAVI